MHIIISVVVRIVSVHRYFQSFTGIGNYIVICIGLRSHLCCKKVKIAGQKKSVKFGLTWQRKQEDFWTYLCVRAVW